MYRLLYLMLLVHINKQDCHEVGIGVGSNIAIWFIWVMFASRIFGAKLVKILSWKYSLPHFNYVRSNFSGGLFLFPINTTYWIIIEWQYESCN